MDETLEIADYRGRVLGADGHEVTVHTQPGHRLVVNAGPQNPLIAAGLATISIFPGKKKNI